MKTLDRKLSRIRSGSFTPADFVMADAGDSDMALGVAAAGPAERGGLKTRTDHLGSMEEIVRPGAVDVMLVSAANGEGRARRGLFAGGPVTRAILAPDTTAERTLFLKIAYNGARALEELVEHDPSLIVGILGGAAGTTRDTFELLSQAMRHGARVALFGRKINLAESPLEMLGFMWRVVRGEVGAAEAVRGYHAALGKKGLRPRRSLEEDSLVTEPVLLPR